MDNYTTITVNGNDYAVVDSKGKKLPGNTGGKDIEYCAILAEEPHIWYEFKKLPFDERLDLRYLYEKLKMDESTGREFIPQFNELLD